MPTLTPTEALTTIERSLRQLFALAFAGGLGSDWFEQVTTEGQRATWAARRAAEGARREPKGVVLGNQSLIEFSELWELIQMAEKHWAHLAAALGKQKAVMPFLRRVDDLRNTTAHSRQLLPFEEDLLSGIAGEIRNRVTIYMNSIPDDNEYWARMESVTDGMGHTIDGLVTIQTSNPHIDTGTTLRVGDIVTFDCWGTDPQGRAMSWSIAFLPNDYSIPQIEAQVGDHVQFVWTVQSYHASALTSVQITMKADSPSHRHSEGWDGFAGFLYKVLPEAS